MEERLDITNYPYPLDPACILFHVVSEGNPIAKGRARIGRHGNLYTPTPTREYEERLAYLVRSKHQAEEPDGVGMFGLRCLFFRDDRQRIDCDNLMKAVADAVTATRNVWKDDSQCLEFTGRLFKKSEEPRCEFIVYQIDYKVPEDECVHCGTKFLMYNSEKKKGRKYCSIQCRADSKRTNVSCTNCQKVVSVPLSRVKKNQSKGQKTFCSRSCSSKYARALGRIVVPRTRLIQGRSNHWRCEHCGGSVSRKEYMRCQGCYLAQKKEASSNYWRLVK